MNIAALFVQKNGVYFNLPFIDAWDEKRDALKYCGNFPVVAHPPCNRWCRLAGLVQARWGYKVGDDGGTFEFALSAVRRCGGVLEHPAYSKAFKAYGLPIPSTGGGWVRGECGGYSCYVEQGRYGHQAKKATWLYCYGASSLPELRWGRARDNESAALVSWCGNKVKRTPGRPRLSKNAASATPVEFRNELIKIANLCQKIEL